MLKKIMRKIKQFHNDRDGSEAVEMVMTTSMMVMFIMIGLMFLSYIMVTNNVNYATKRICREIETTGTVNVVQMENRFEDMLSSTQLINKSIAISDVTYHSPGKIQLKETFLLTGECDYVIQLINPGSFTGYRLTLPVKTVVGGMSEVYWGS